MEVVGGSRAGLRIQVFSFRDVSSFRTIRVASVLRFGVGTHHLWA